MLLFNKKFIGTHNPRALNNLLLCIGMLFGYRGRGELKNIKYGDFKVICENGNLFLTLDRERVTKTRQGETPRNGRLEMPKLAAIEDLSRCPVHAFTLYQRLRNPKMGHPDSQLYINSVTKVTDPRVEWPQHELWYSSSVMGINKIGSF